MPPPPPPPPTTTTTTTLHWVPLASTRDRHQAITLTEGENGRSSHQDEQDSELRSLARDESVATQHATARALTRKQGGGLAGAGRQVY